MSNTEARRFAEMVKHYADKDDRAINLEYVEWSDTVQIARSYLALEARCAALESENKELNHQLYMKGGLRYWDTGLDFQGMRVILHSDDAVIDRFKEVSNEARAALTDNGGQG